MNIEASNLMLAVVVLILFIFIFHVNLFFFEALVHILLLMEVVVVLMALMLLVTIFFVMLIILVILLMVLSIELVGTSSMRDIVLLHYQLVLLLGLLSEWLGTLGAVTKLLQVLIHAVSKHHFPAILSHGILSPQVTKCISVRLIDTLGNHLLPAVNPLTLSAKLLFLILALLPLFVCDASHDALVGLSLSLALL